MIANKTKRETLLTRQGDPINSLVGSRWGKGEERIKEFMMVDLGKGSLFVTK